MFTLTNTLGKEIDKTGTEVVIQFANYVGAGPSTLLAFYYKSMADTIELGYANNAIEIHNKCKAVYVEIDGKIVGACVIDWHHATLSVYVVLTAIDKEYRGRGLYKIMFDYLEKWARSQGAVEITSVVNIDNETSLNARIAVGMLPVSYKTRKLL